LHSGSTWWRGRWKPWQCREETAFIVQGEILRVIGRGAVYVIDGAAISFANMAQDRPEGITSIYDVKLHILTHEAQYDIKQWRPLSISKQLASS
jgi:cyanophycinase-like exopeptidase